MEYFVIGPDGQEYGPTNVDGLREWAAQNRLISTTMLKNVATGETVAASTIPGLFPSAPPAYPNYSQPPTAVAYPRYQPPAQTSRGGSEYLWRSILYSLGAVLLFFVAHGFGLIFAAYSMYYAIQTQRDGSKYGVIAIVISAIALIAVGGGWILRVVHMG